MKSFFSVDGFFPVPYKESSFSMAPLLQMHNLQNTNKYIIYNYAMFLQCWEALYTNAHARKRQKLRYMLFHDLLKLYFNATINELAKKHFLNNQNNDPYCENYIDTGIPYTKGMR